METPSTPPLEELLSHADWARALARRILRDEQRADDVVQEAWLAAVERPPRPEPGLRVWFARLIRNLANNLRRAEQRRARHERDAAAPALAPPSSAPLVDELAAQQLVAQALLALDEPYRETLIRRWYRDEKPAAIARAMQVPVKTVDTRLARGLERLRAELTARRGGASREWCLMLAPLAQAGTATGVVAAWTGGALTMTGLAKLAAAVVVAAAAVATWIAIERSSGENAVPRIAAVDANGRGPTQDAVASPQEAAFAPARKPDSTSVVSPAPSPKDVLSGWRGEWTLRGRIVEKTSRAPLAGVAVTAQVAGLMFGADLETVNTDANGEFTLDHLGAAISMRARAPGCLSFDVPIGKDELAAAASAPLRVFEMEKLTFGDLVCTLRSRDGRPLPSRIRNDANVVYSMASIGGYEHERFDRMPLPIANGPGREMVIPAEREGDVFRIEHAPARTPIMLFARLDHSDVGRLRIEPLAPNETRAIEIPVDAGIVVDVECRDAATTEHVSMEWAASYTLRLAWNGPRAIQHSERSMQPRELEGALLLPTPGRIRITGTLDGFAPIDWSGDVVDGSRVTIPLTRWRQLFVKVVTADGKPWKQRPWHETGGSATTHSSGHGFMDSGRAPDCVLVLDGAPLPEELDFDAPRLAKLGGKIGSGKGGYFNLDGFEGFAPSIALRIGIYDDGRLIGSAEVPAKAPLDDLPPAPSGAASVPDAPRKPWADRYGPTQAVTVTIDPPPTSDGSLRFRAVTSEDGKPAAHYEVELEPLVFGEFAAGWGSSGFKVDDAESGLFSATAIPAGDWRMRIRRGRVGIDGWLGVVSIVASHETDLGTLTLQCPGALDIRVVDEAGAPAADAEVHVTNGTGAQPLEFSIVRGQVHQTAARSDARGEVRLELASGKARVEVNSAGYAPAFADVEVPANGEATCTVTLKELASRDAPPAPEKR